MKSSKKLQISSYLLFVYINNHDRKWRTSVLCFPVAALISQLSNETTDVHTRVGQNPSTTGFQIEIQNPRRKLISNPKSEIFFTKGFRIQSPNSFLKLNFKSKIQNFFLWQKTRIESQPT